MQNGSVVIFLKISQKSTERSTAMSAEAIAGAKSAGMTVKDHYLDLDFKCHKCSARNQCENYQNSMATIYGDFAVASGIIITSPNYYFTKLLSEATYCWYFNKGGTSRPLYPDKKVVAIYNQGNTDINMYHSMIDHINKGFNMLGWTVVTNFLVTNKDTDELSFNDLLRQARAAGYALTVGKGNEEDIAD